MQKTVAILLWLTLINFFHLKSYCQDLSLVLEGTVTDSLENPIPFATVNLYKSGVLKKQAKTDFNGKYKFNKLKSQVYIVEVTSMRFEKFVSNIDLKKQNELNSNFQLVKLKNCNKITKIGCALFYERCELCGHKNNGSLAFNDNSNTYHGYREWCAHFRKKIYLSVNKEGGRRIIVK